MSEPMNVAPNPCATCPYLKVTPPGVWDEREYAKLAGYDADPCLLPPFGCHETAGQEPGNVCRGWLGVHHESVSVRLAIMSNRLRAEDVGAIPDKDKRLYKSGTAAMLAGLKGVDKPGKAAQDAVLKIARKRGLRR